jgi:lactoylglutathione lyase
MSTRAFPVLYSDDVERSARFYGELLGFEEHARLPAEGDAGYVGLRRGAAEIAIVSAAWPRDELGLSFGREPRFELFVYVDGVDAHVERARSSGSRVLREAQDMPWGERIAHVSDPDGNPVALAEPVSAGS